MDVIVVGNVTLDVICFPVEDVPRFDSISFEKSMVSPGGCGSNLSIGLAACGVDVSLVARLGNDDPGRLVKSYLSRWGIDLAYLQISQNQTTAISVGLVDRQYQPRFIHTPGANASLISRDIDVHEYRRYGAKILGVVGFFVLPGLLDGHLGDVLIEAQRLGMTTVLDVVHSPRMDQPEYLWPVLPGLDVFLCNSQEAERITGINNYKDAAAELRFRGAKNVVVKLGSDGCWLDSESSQVHLVGDQARRVIDTTGAGDAFAAGLIAALVRGDDIQAACRAGNKAGALIVSEMGATTAWGQPDSGP